MSVHERERGAGAFLRYGGVLVGGIAVCMVLGTYALLHLRPGLPLLVLAFCGPFVVYQAERALRLAPEDRFNHPGRLAWVARHRRYVWMSTGLAAAVGVATLPLLRRVTVGAGVGLALLSLLYMVPLLPGRRRLKAAGFVKPALIAGAWAVGGVLLPVLEAGVPLRAAVPALIGYRFLFILPNALLADWPDRAGDARAGLYTVATRFSERHVRGMAIASLVLGLIGGGAALLIFDTSWLLGVDLAGLGVMLVCLARPLPQSRLFYGVVLDLVVAWPGLTALCAALGGA